MAEFIAQALQVKKVSQEAAKDIYEKTQGNPFLTEAVVNALRDRWDWLISRDLIFFSSGCVTIDKNGEGIIATEGSKAIPSELNGLLTSKIDHLSPQEQIILKWGLCAQD